MYIKRLPLCPSASPSSLARRTNIFLPIWSRFKPMWAPISPRRAILMPTVLT